MISLDHLRTLSLFVQKGSMAAAAKELGISQPAVSMQLRALETSCPEPLFLSHGQRKTLSPFGQKLYEMTHSLTLELSQRSANLIQKPDQTKVRLAGRDIVIETVLKKISHWPCQLEVISCSSAEAAEKIANHEADMAVSYKISQQSDLIGKKLFTSTPVLAFANTKHYSSLIKKPLNQITGSDLLKYRFLIHQKNDLALKQLCKIKCIAIQDLNIGLVTTNWSLILRSALMGEGVALMPSEIIPTGETHNLKVISLSERDMPTFDYHLIYSRHFVKNKFGREWVDQILTSWR